ncbi:hypothetical protein BBJ29_006101 [Phytophthora kernoviae]|uniref:AB hydrolase-1 domain-containing protein n=1 Tax=Phytophthora kernoviae TaxID=325452 RepID=A0A3F2RIL5_9STRA|nr:hypothetical protein BBJ29_006101 [Phytophthora kernoviae]RLN57769.1 hypothetical protein BBP00_00007360 [Phytophthora kernoviae]
MLTPSDCECGHAHGDEREPDDTEDQGEDQPGTSLAYQLWYPFRLIVLNPLPVLIAFVIANTIFVTLGALLRLLAQLLTLPGLLLGLLLALLFGIRRVASLMAYPGQLKLVIREGEANFARLTKRRLQIFAEAASDLAVVLDPNVSGGSQRLRFLQAHQNFSFALETMMMPVLQSLEIVEKDGNLGTSGKKLLKALREVVKVNSQKLSEPCSKLCSASEKTFEIQRVKLFKDAKPEAAALAKATETPRVKLFGAPEDDYIATLEMLRADMTVRFKGEQIWIPGYQGHQIDAMLMPPATSGRDAVDRPVVMLCNPNGGLYEFHHLQMDWIKFYTSDLDCHVLVYNYRGYGRCKGSPSPELHNLDGLAIVNYLKSERGVKTIAVHGESIGGIVATYLARKSPHAAESGGYDKIRAWTASLLTWGGHVAPEHRNVTSLDPFDRDGIVIVPITVAEMMPYNDDGAN